MDNYQAALQKTQTIAECQALYEAELANKKIEYQKLYPKNYLTMLAACEVDYWIKAENRAKVLKRNNHTYGNIIRRQQFM